MLLFMGFLGNEIMWASNDKYVLCTAAPHPLPVTDTADQSEHSLWVMFWLDHCQLIKIEWELRSMCYPDIRVGTFINNTTE